MIRVQPLAWLNDGSPREKAFFARSYYRLCVCLAEQSTREGTEASSSDPNDNSLPDVRQLGEQYGAPPLILNAATAAALTFAEETPADPLALCLYGTYCLILACSIDGLTEGFEKAVYEDVEFAKNLLKSKVPPKEASKQRQTLLKRLLWPSKPSASWDDLVGRWKVATIEADALDITELYEKSVSGSFLPFSTVEAVVNRKTWSYSPKYIGKRSPPPDEPGSPSPGPWKPGARPSRDSRSTQICFNADKYAGGTLGIVASCHSSLV